MEWIFFYFHCCFFLRCFKKLMLAEEQKTVGIFFFLIQTSRILILERPFSHKKLKCLLWKKCLKCTLWYAASPPASERIVCCEMKPVLSLKARIGHPLSLGAIGKESKCMSCTERLCFGLCWFSLFLLLKFWLIFGKPEKLQVTKHYFL